MKFKLLVLIATLLVYTPTLQAQTKEELQELMNSEPNGKSKKKEKPKAAEKTKAEPAKKETKEAPKTAETQVEPKKETTAAKPENKASAKTEKLKEIADPQKLSWKKNKKLGDSFTSRGSIYNAAKYYEAALSKNQKKTYLHQNIADAYFDLRDYEQANIHYKALVSLDSIKHKNIFSIYQYALSSKYLGKYEVAKASFSSFNSLAKEDDKLTDYRKTAAREIDGCNLAISYLNSKEMPEYKVSHLDKNINQPLTDFSPVVNNQTLYYGSWNSDSVVLENKKEKYAVFSRLSTAKLNGNNWSRGQLVEGGINDAAAHVGNSAISQDGKTMYFTQCNQNEIQQMICDIYKSAATADGWSAGQKLDGNVNAEGFTTTHPALGKNEAGDNVLYFSSNRNMVKGMDIYSAKMNADGSFAKAKSVGPAINTKGDESTPSFDFKNNTLYFSSNGHVNIGAADVFKSSISGGEWTTPVNMGTPINSSVDDLYFNWNEAQATGFVVSNRTGGFGLKSPTCCDDIYEVGKTKLYFAVKGTMQNSDSSYKAIENSLVTLYDKSTGKQLKSFYATDGSYFFDLEPEKEYSVIARKKDFEDLIFSTSTVGKRSNDTVTLDFPMKEIPQIKTKVGESLGIVYWEFNRDNLMADAPATLKTVVDFMNTNPQYVLEIGSHTDAKGTEEYNTKLAQRRSDAVLKFLLSKKIPAFRLVSKAYGESMPVELNEDPLGTDNPNGRTKNRRTEFKVIKELSAIEIDTLKDTKVSKPENKKTTNKATDSKK